VGERIWSIHSRALIKEEKEQRVNKRDGFVAAAAAGE